MIDAHHIYFSRFNSSDLQKDEEIGEVCIANISPLERRKRLVFGIQQFIFTLAALVVLMIAGADPLWRVMLFFLFSAATVSCFQALDKT